MIQLESLCCALPAHGRASGSRSGYSALVACTGSVRTRTEQPRLRSVMSRQSGLSLNARRTLRPTRAAAGGDPYGDSPFMRSEVVQKEAADIYKDFSLLSQMQPKYLSFDTEGKRLYIEHLEGFVEKLKIFTFRYELSDDPYAKDTIRTLNEKLSMGGLTIKTLTSQMTSMLELMRNDLEKEAARGPSAAGAGQAGSKAFVQGGPFGQAGMPDIAKLLEDPEVRDALMDPFVIKAVQDVMANPSNINKKEYRENAKLALLFLKMFNAQRGAQGGPPGAAGPGL